MADGVPPDEKFIPAHLTSAAVDKVSETIGDGDPPRFGLGFRERNGYVELFVRNMSLSNTMHAVKVIFPNFSKTSEGYVPEDLHYRLNTVSGLECPIDIDPGGQEYFRVVKLNAASIEDSRFRLISGDTEAKSVEGDELVAKLRVSAQDVKSQNIYIWIHLDNDGNWNLDQYRRVKRVRTDGAR